MNQEYAALMQHLKQQFSMENLLFVTILLQWEQYLCENGYWQDMVDNASTGNDKHKLCHIGVSSGSQPIQLPPNVPKSPIVHFLFANANANANTSKRSDPIMTVDHQQKENGDNSCVSKQQRVTETTKTSIAITLAAKQRIGSESNLHNNGNRLQLNYAQFGAVFNELYRQYIEADRAPFEINISSDNRNTMKSYYLLIQQKNQCPKNDSNYSVMDKETFVQLWQDLLCVCDEIFSVLFVSISEYHFNK